MGDKVCGHQLDGTRFDPRTRDDEPEIFNCYYCGEIIDEGEEYEYNNKTCCFDCMQFQTNLFE